MKINYFCDFNKEYDYNPSIKHNIICLTLFRLKHLYKSFEDYLFGLEEIDKKLQSMNNIEYDIKFRLMYNDTIYDTNNEYELNRIKKIMDSVKKNKHIQLIKYNCPNYKLDDLYDKGIFPFFIRYFYFYNFEDNDTNYVFAADIDITRSKASKDYVGFMIDVFSEIIKLKTGFIYYNSKCYVPFWKKKLSINDSITVLGGHIGGNVKLEPEIFVDFLNDCKDGIQSTNELVSKFYKYYNEYLNDKRIPFEYKKKKILSYKVDKIFVYGLDEFYMTYFILPQVLKDFKIKNVYEKIRNSASTGGIGPLIHDTLSEVLHGNNSDTTLNIYNKILRKVFDKDIDLDNTIEYLHKFIDKFSGAHDYDGNSGKPELYDKFHKLILQILDSEDGKYLKLNKKTIICFVMNDKYYTDKNNMVKLTKEQRKLYVKLLSSTIELL